MNQREKAEQQYQADIGQELVTLLNLKENEDGRYDTAWGDKTPLGLYLTVKRIMDNK